MAAEIGRVLVVDDVEANRDLLSRRLKQQGHAVSVAENGRRALEMVRAEPFDLVLLDIMMPEMDGYQVLSEMMSDPALKHIPVIMISAVTEMDSVVKCIELGATDYLPKPFNPVLLKARVGATLEKKRLRDKERLWAKSLERELEIGREIQKSFLPEELPQVAGWEIAALFRPARQVAGDFYDAFSLPSSGRIGLVIADVCDKGVGAALFMALFRSLLRATATGAASGPEPGTELLRTVRLTNDYIARTHGRSNMFATLFFGVLDPATGSLLYVNGGHEAPVHFGPGGAKSRLSPTGPAVGMMPDMPFEVRETRLEAGEGLLAFTDGVTDARGASGLYGEGRLLALLGQPVASAAALLDAIEAGVLAHAAGAEQADDITLLAVLKT
ncbi:MAG TPA: SpoIIE family protein phosphatase [Thermoanaerobaculia bacterium]|nr:SpoIIE family protein phosphatase [Thermoanaerobaculia bacterium]